MRGSVGGGRNKKGLCFLVLYFLFVFTFFDFYFGFVILCLIFVLFIVCDFYDLSLYRIVYSSSSSSSTMVLVSGSYTPIYSHSFLASSIITITSFDSLCLR